MAKSVCKGGPCRKRFAVSICYAAATLLSLEALHGSRCMWLDLDIEQTFALDAGLSTLFIFLGTYILTQLISKD